MLMEGEILLAGAVLGTGIQALGIRMALGLMDRVSPPRQPLALLVLRGVVLLAGALYGLSFWNRTPGTPGETLGVMLLLGGALVALGLNRTAEMRFELLEQVARSIRPR
jgi:hypothetical protein